eukprot:TRINITY_DN8284_c0_g1_i2.p1 TRINITY_DN8284_c0_g1~~TRINITY_DN8284_c0_g1_i2.p1  ORF type:complete len:366 (+),score=84.61 TRINITY_DN8284_c0_g1_i2:256-1353(+)
MANNDSTTRPPLRTYEAGDKRVHPPPPAPHPAPSSPARLLEPPPKRPPLIFHAKQIHSQTRRKKRRRPPGWREFLAGGVAGSISRTLTSPLDVVKTLFQLQTQPIGHGTRGRYSGYLPAFGSIAREEGVRAFWKGNYTAIVRLFPYSGIKFLVFENVNCYGKNKTGGAKPSLWWRFVAGACAGTVAVAVTHPLDVIRARFVLQKMGRKRVYISISHCAKMIYRTEGIAGFYKGIAPGMMGVIPYEGGTFAAYVAIKSLWPWDSRSIRTHLVAGWLAGAFAQTISYPFDLIKKRLQVQSDTIGMPPVRYAGMVDCARQIFRAEGVLGFYKGTLANLAKVAPFVAIQFACYEQIKAYMFQPALKPIW